MLRFRDSLSTARDVIVSAMDSMEPAAVSGIRASLSVDFSSDHRAKVSLSSLWIGTRASRFDWFDNAEVTA
jgi:hypothetical protein